MQSEKGLKKGTSGFINLDENKWPPFDLSCVCNKINLTMYAVCCISTGRIAREKKQCVNSQSETIASFCLFWRGNVSMFWLLYESSFIISLLNSCFSIFSSSHIVYNRSKIQSLFQNLLIIVINLYILKFWKEHFSVDFFDFDFFFFFLKISQIIICLMLICMYLQTNISQIKCIYRSKLTVATL